MENVSWKVIKFKANVVLKVAQFCALIAHTVVSKINQNQEKEREKKMRQKEKMQKDETAYF